MAAHCRAIRERTRAPSRGRPRSNRRCAGQTFRLSRTRTSCGVFLGLDERPLVVKHGPQLSDRVVKPGPNGPDRNFKSGCDVLERVTEVMAHYDHGPSLRTELAERL